MKHNETKIENALTSIMKLSPQIYDKTFEFKDVDFKGTLEENNYITEAGLIAQEVYEIDEFKKYVIVGDEKDAWDINYNNLFVYNIKATQELNEKNIELETKNTELENKIIDLEQKYNNLLSRIEALEGSS